MDMRRYYPETNTQNHAQLFPREQPGAYAVPGSYYSRNESESRERQSQEEAVVGFDVQVVNEQQQQERARRMEERRQAILEEEERLREMESRLRQMQQQPAVEAIPIPQEVNGNETENTTEKVCCKDRRPGVVVTVAVLLVVLAAIAVGISLGVAPGKGETDGDQVSLSEAPTTNPPTVTPISPTSEPTLNNMSEPIHPTSEPTHPTIGWYEMALYNKCIEGPIIVSILYFGEFDDLNCLEGLLLQYEEGGFLTERTPRPYFFTYAESVSGQYVWDGSELDHWNGSGELPEGATVKQNCGRDEPVKMAVVNRVVRQNVLLMEFNC